MAGEAGLILVVEDEANIASIVRDYLQGAGFRVLVASDGEAGLKLARSYHPDLVILDLMLPKIDGLDVCRELRKTSAVPIIMLTARAQELDRVLGLELGADDYLTKPFSPRELVARVRAVLRRTQGPAELSEKLTLGDLSLDTAAKTLWVKGERVGLTPTEYHILETLMRSPGRVFSRQALLEASQGDAFEGYERNIDTHIKNLRRKLEEVGIKAEFITTVYGMGYRLDEDIMA